MTKKIFIDGASGTTGLQIRSLLEEWEKAGRIEIISVKDHRDLEQRIDAHAQADLSVLCLPDDIARATVPLLQNMNTKILDASSAHRTDPAWTYGFPELNKDQGSKIAKARLVTNPGCFATGAISILKPLVDAGIIDKGENITIIGTAGYSSGGKKMIEKYQDQDSDAPSFAAHSLNAKHRHVDEIKKIVGLQKTPVFLPHVINEPRGMMVSITFNGAASPQTIHKALSDVYNIPDSKVRVAPLDLSKHKIDFDTTPNDSVALYVTGWNDGNDRQTSVHAMLDNLGKGAATQAMQNIALMLDL